MSVTYHLNGFVLNRENKRENDLVISFYSREKGKVHVLVRGAKKINSKLTPIIAEPFSFLKLTIVQGRINHLIGGEKRERFSEILKQEKKLIPLNALFSQINKIIKSEPDLKIFSLIHKFLKVVNKIKEENTLLIMNAFLIKFLSFLGYCPEIKRCLICGKTPKNKEMLFSLSKGGIICEKHYKKIEEEADEVIKIKPKDLEILQKLLYQDFNSLLKQSFFQRDLKRAEMIIKNFFIWHLP